MFLAKFAELLSHHEGSLEGPTQIAGHRFKHLVTMCNGLKQCRLYFALMHLVHVDMHIPYFCVL